ncbi:MAG: hypothetical protein WC713_09895, partial [Candidatus Methylomirabilota bacterium]
MKSPHLGRVSVPTTLGARVFRASAILAVLLAMVVGGLVTPTSAQAPPTFNPYDDFSTARLDPARWASPREQVREIRDGELVLALGGTLPPNATVPVTIQLGRVNLPPPQALTALQADLRVTDFTPTEGGRSRLRLRGAWYNADFTDAQSGDGATGDVRGGINFQGTSSGLKIVYGFIKCTNATCSISQNLEGGTLLPSADLNRTYIVGITYSGGQFVFTVDGEPIGKPFTSAVLPQGGPKQGEVLLRADLQCPGDPPTCAGGPGYVAGAFDNVTVNGTLFEDFAGPWIDRSKWAPGEIGSEVAGEAWEARLHVPAIQGSNQTVLLRIANPETVHALAADVTVNTLDLSSTAEVVGALAGIEGRFYNISADPTPGGDVYATVGLAFNYGGSGLNFTFQAWRNDETNGYTSLINHTEVLDLPVPTSQWLFLIWDPVAQTFTYGIEDQAWTFDPKPLAPLGSPAPSTHYKVLRAFGGASASSDVTLRATFDNVAVNGSVSATRTLNVLLAGTGTGTVTSSLAGI